LCGLPLEKFIMFNGCGRNGKGLENDLYLRALGHYGMIANNSILTGRRTTGANPEIANLDHKRLVIFREPSSRDKLQNGIIKELTGGGTLSARGLYEKDTQKVLTMTCIVECNNRPLFAEVPQVAEMERVIDILFRNTFTDNEEDINPENGVHRGNPRYKELSFQIQHRCAFLKIIMEAYTRYENEKRCLRIPYSIKERTNQYLQMSCELTQWILDNYDKTDNPKDVVKVKEMFGWFKSSEYYENLSKTEKRKQSEKNFIETISKNVFLKKYYCERKKIDKKEYYNFLWGFKTPNQEVIAIDE